MSAALLLAASEPELERHLPEDGFLLVPPHGRFDLVLASDVEDVDRFAQHAPVIVIGPEEADAVDRVHAFRKGCDDYVPRPDCELFLARLSRTRRSTGSTKSPLSSSEMTAGVTTTSVRRIGSTL